MSIIITIIILAIIFNALTSEPTNTYNKYSSPLSGSLDKLDTILEEQLIENEATMATIKSSEHQDNLNKLYTLKMRKELQDKLDKSKAKEEFRATYYAMVAERLAEQD